MNRGAIGFSLLLSFATAAQAQEEKPAAASKDRAAEPALHGQILELLKQDATKAAAKSKRTVAPTILPSINPQPVSDQSVEEGVLELEPLRVT